MDLPILKYIYIVLPINKYITNNYWDFITSSETLLYNQNKYFTKLNSIEILLKTKNIAVQK